MSTKLAKAFDEASASLSDAVGFDHVLEKASHDAMAHHATHAAAAAKAGKMDEAAQHQFMHMRHALESCRGKRHGSMRDAMRRNIDHYAQEGEDEVNRHGYYVSMDDPDREKKQHPAEKHFRRGGGFVPHGADKSFAEDYKGKKDGPKVGKK